MEDVTTDGMTTTQVPPPVSREDDFQLRLNQEMRRIREEYRQARREYQVERFGNA